MALNTFTFDHYPNRQQLGGGDQDSVICVFTFRGDASWTAAGEAFDLTEIGMDSVSYLHVQPILSGTEDINSFVYDDANDKLLSFLTDISGPTIAEPSTTNFTAVTMRGIAYGVPQDFNVAA